MRLPASLLALVLATACTTQTMQTPPAAPANTLSFQTTAAADAGLLSLANAYRASQGLAPLRSTASLNAAAMAHARDMTSNGFFNHTGSDGSTVGSRTRAAGCSWTGVAENIAWGQTDPSSAMTTWINSSGHRRNLLGPYTQFGEARIGTTWVTVFATGC